MQTRADRARPRLDYSGDASGLEGGCGFKRRARAERIVAVALLEWCLQFPKRGCVHPAMVAPIQRTGLGTSQRRWLRLAESDLRCLGGSGAVEVGHRNGVPGCS
jgi:hypothetical protein